MKILKEKTNLVYVLSTDKGWIDNNYQNRDNLNSDTLCFKTKKEAEKQAKKENKINPNYCAVQELLKYNNTFCSEDEFDDFMYNV